MLVMLRQVDAWQWVMLAATFAISGFMLLAHSANAYPAAPTGHPHATTLSHCGWLPLPPERHYTGSARSVRIIQQKLQGLGFDVGAPGIDGQYGPLSRSAVKRFQMRYHLAANGEVTGDTASLLAYASHANPYVRRCQGPAAWR